MTGTRDSKNILRKVLQSLGVILLFVTAVFLLVPLMEQDNAKPSEYSAKWMSDLDDDLLLSDINIPGTHDSATEYCDFGFFSKCQSKEIRDQLDSGYRYLDIRLGIDYVCGEPVLKLVHGSTTCKTGASIFASTLYLDEVLNQCYEFFVANPKETVIFAVKYEKGDLPVAEFEELLDSYVSSHEDYWCLTNSIPTLGEARGKLVLMRRYDDEASLQSRSGVNIRWTEQGEKLADMPAEEITDNGDRKCMVQDRYIYGKNDKWKAFTTGMSHALERETEEVAINFLSTKGGFVVGHPYFFAATLNKQFMDYNLEQRTNDRNYGWIVVDFGSEKIAEKIYTSNWQ